jgi:hypothetical protein
MGLNCSLVYKKRASWACSPFKIILTLIAGNKITKPKNPSPKEMNRTHENDNVADAGDQHSSLHYIVRNNAKMVFVLGIFHSTNLNKFHS